MNQIERLVTTTSLKTELLAGHIDRGQSLFMRYDKLSDDLILTIVPNTVETVVHYIDDHVALLYTAENMEVVGFQVEAFTHSFISNHSTLESAWKLSDSDARLSDVDDLIVVFERKKQVVARELKQIADNTLGRYGASREMIPV